MVLCYSNELCLNGSCIGSKYQCLYKQLWPHAGSQASHFLWQAVPLALLARDGFLIGVLSPLYTEMLLFDSSWQQDECPWRTKKSNPKPVKVNHFTFKDFEAKKNTCWILQRCKSLQQNPKHGGKFKNVVLSNFNLELSKSVLNLLIIIYTLTSAISFLSDNFFKKGKYRYSTTVFSKLSYIYLIFYWNNV